MKGEHPVMADRTAENGKMNRMERGTAPKKGTAYGRRAFQGEKIFHERAACHGRGAFRTRKTFRRKDTVHGKRISSGISFGPGKESPAKTKARSRVTQSRPLRYYAVIFSTLALLVTAAFFAPQILFQVQDAILCKDTVLTQQESLNVEALSTTYEKSLRTRMQHYAEGLSENRTFYTTSQNLTVTSEVREYIYSDKGLFSQQVSSFAEQNMLPWYIWEQDYTILRWKQYVIYSDDFSEGVNFILWYVEMQDQNGYVVKLLSDAEDGTIYALKTEGKSYTISDGHESQATEVGVVVDGTRYIDELFWNDHAATQIWGMLAYNYDCLDDSEIKDFHILVGEYGWTGGYMSSDGYDERYVYDEADRKRKDIINSDILARYEAGSTFPEKVRYYMEDDNKVIFQLPYGEARLDVMLEISVDEDSRSYIYNYPDMKIGIRQIYEMIPEFA